MAAKKKSNPKTPVVDQGQCPSCKNPNGSEACKILKIFDGAVRTYFIKKGVIQESKEEYTGEYWFTAPPTLRL